MIHLDHAATSPMRPSVREAIAPWLGVPANPASAHASGQRAAAAVEAARQAVADLVGGVPEGVIFTSGATEANHQGLLGAFGPGDRLAVSPIEHPCVVGAAAQAASRGVALATLPVGADGRVRLDGVDADGIALLAAHFETGVVQDLHALEALAARGVRVHVDAAHAAGRIPLSLGWAEAVVLSAHKLGGPPGIGALVLRHGGPFPPLLVGTQERGRRGGTVPTAWAVGFGEAARGAAADLAGAGPRLSALRDRVDAALRAAGARVVGAGAPRVPGTSLGVFPDLEGEGLVHALDLAGVAVSAGAACASGSLEPSPSLRAMGVAHPEGALRVSLGWSTTPDDVAAFEAALPRVVTAARVAAAL